MSGDRISPSGPHFMNAKILLPIFILTSIIQGFLLVRIEEQDDNSFYIPSSFLLCEGDSFSLQLVLDNSIVAELCNK